MRKDSERSDASRLEDMLGAVRRIREIASVGREEFNSDPNAQEAVAFQLMSLGNAAEKMSKRTKNANPDVPWENLGNIRWSFAHEYFATDLTTTWTTVHRDLNGIERKLRRVRVGTDDE